MHSNRLIDLSFAVALMTIAGYVDAIGYLRLGHLFVSFMSGDSTQFAVFIADGKWQRALAPGAIVALFVASVFIGRMIELRTKGWCRSVLLCSEALLLGAAIVTIRFADVGTILMVIAMGVQNTVIRHVGETRTAVTYVTGALVDLGEKIGDLVCGPGRGEPWAWATYFAFWLGLVIGAGAGGYLYVRIGAEALAVPTVLLLSFAIAAAIPSLRARAAK